MAVLLQFRSHFLRWLFCDTLGHTFFYFELVNYHVSRSLSKSLQYVMCYKCVLEFKELLPELLTVLQHYRSNMQGHHYIV